MDKPIEGANWYKIGLCPTFYSRLVKLVYLLFFVVAVIALFIKELTALVGQLTIFYWACSCDKTVVPLASKYNVESAITKFMLLVRYSVLSKEL